MTQIIFLAREKLARLLKDGAASIYVATRYPGLTGLEGNTEPVTKLHVGKSLPLPAPVFFFEEHMLVSVTFSGVRTELSIPYRAILRCDRFAPPSNGGTRIRMTA